MKLFFLSILISLPVWAADDVCDIIELPNCRKITKQLRRNTFQTAPNKTTAASFNPANVGLDRGLGLEALAQPNNPLLYSLTSGTGKMGGALISGSLDNSFFGNRTPELDEALIDRSEEKKRYKNDKFSFAAAAKIFSQKYYGLDVGFIAKRHSEIKDINLGGGLSGRIWLLHFGASAFKDDYFIDLVKAEEIYGVPYTMIYGKENLQENFLVTTYTVGTRIQNFSFDIGSITSKLETYGNRPTKILLYSASFNYENWLFNAAMRKEHSEASVYDKDTDSVKFEEDKTESYYGVQYAIGKHLILGLNYNYFLLKDYSASLTLFI